MRNTITYGTRGRGAEMDKARRAVQAVIDQAGDPREYRVGLARHAGVDVSVIDAIIAESDAPREATARTVAEERIDSRTYRQWSRGTGLNTYDD